MVSLTLNVRLYFFVIVYCPTFDGHSVLFSPVQATSLLCRCFLRSHISNCFWLFTLASPFPLLPVVSVIVPSAARIGQTMNSCSLLNFPPRLRCLCLVSFSPVPICDFCGFAFVSFGVFVLSLSLYFFFFQLTLSLLSDRVVGFYLGCSFLPSVFSFVSELFFFPPQFSLWRTAHLCLSLHPVPFAFVSSLVCCALPWFWLFSLWMGLRSCVRPIFLP